jgi:hypothetical protein
MGPEPPTQVRPSRRATRLAFIASGAVPLLALCGAPPDTMLLIYSVFVGAWVLRGRTSISGRRLPGPVWVHYFVLMVLVGFLTETLAWAGSYLARAEQPALLHPQLFYDLLLSPGIYGAWAVGWIVLTRRWRFSLAEVFVVQGVYGVFIEQQGAVFLKGLGAMPLGLVLWLYVFVVYGSAAGLAYLPFERALPPAQVRDSGWKYPAAMAVQFVTTAVVAIGWGLLLTAVGVVIPEPRPIWLAPFW